MNLKLKSNSEVGIHLISQGNFDKGPVNQAAEKSSFILTVCVKSVPRYHFKLACVILQMAVKELFETHF